MDYRQYIQSPEWKVRSRLYRNAHPKCEICGCDDKFELRCHHISYDHLGDEPDEDLMTLCQSCHQIVEHIKKYNTSEPVLHYSFALRELEYKDIGDCVQIKRGFWIHRTVKKSLGDYSLFYDMIKERTRKLYPLREREYDYFRRIEQRFSGLEKDIKAEATDDYSLNIKKLRKSEVDIRNISGFSEDEIETTFGPSFATSFYINLFDSLNGIETMITDIVDSADNLRENVFCTEGEDEEDSWIFFTSVNVAQYLFEVIDCYQEQYPNLAHNAKVLAYIMIPSIRTLCNDIKNRQNYTLMFSVQEGLKFQARKESEESIGAQWHSLPKKVSYFDMIACFDALETLIPRGSETTETEVYSAFEKILLKENLFKEKV